MICKVCGANNEDYMEYCENCSAQLIADEPATEQAPAQEEKQEQGYDSYVESTGETPPAWGFVKAPSWPKPSFDADTVSEDDIPKNYKPSFNPRPAERPVRPAPVNPSPAPTEANNYVNNVRTHSATAAPVQNAQRTPVQPVRNAQAVQNQPVARQTPQHNYVPNNAAPIAPVAPAVENDYDEDYSYSYEKKAKNRKNSGGSSLSGKNIAFIAAAAILVILIAVLGVLYVNKVHAGDFSKFISCTFKGDPVTRTPVIQTDTTEDGSPAYLIKVYAKRNYTVRYTKDDTQLERTIGKNQRYIPFVVPQSILIPDEPLNVAQYSVVPDFFTIISPSGEETPVVMEENLVVDVPALQLNVEQPTVTDFTTDTPVVPISGGVGDNTVAIFVNDTQIAIDEAGNFATAYTLEAEGAYEITVEARKNGCRTASQTFNVTYSTGSGTAQTGGETTTDPTAPAQGNISFSVNSDVARIGTSSTMTVNGKMESGAIISVTGVELDGDVNQDSAAGTFSFTVKTPKVGLYEVLITATKDSSAKSTTFYLEHQPDKDPYMQSVHKMDYNRITQYPNHEQGYKIVGKVTEIIVASPYVKARIQTSDGDLIFYYYSGVASIELNDGKTYELYADPFGTDEATGLAQMHAWFVKKRGN